MWRLFLLGLLGSCGPFTSSLEAWDACGHELVAALALNHLNPKAKAAVEALAKEVPPYQGPYDAVTVACWMDDIKSFQSHQPYQGLFKSWHYIDLGLDLSDPVPAFAPGNDNEVEGNVVQGLMRAEVVLRGGHDPYVKNKAMACAMVMHLVGDIHQPLHAATAYFRSHGGRLRTDSGGNKVTVLNGPETERKFNLHYFWDGSWRASYNASTGRVELDPRYDSMNHDARQIADLAQAWAVDPPPQKVGTNLDYPAWARESNRLAREVAYGKLIYGREHAVQLDQNYVEAAQKLARSQIVLASYRLALVLNTTLGAESSGPIPKGYPAGPPSPEFR